MRELPRSKEEEQKEGAKNKLSPKMISTGADYSVRKVSDNEFTGSAGELCVMELMCQHDAKQLNNAGEEEIGLGGECVGSFSFLNTESDLESIDGAFYGGALFVNRFKSGVITGDAGIKTQVIVWIDVDAFAVLAVCARLIAPATFCIFAIGHFQRFGARADEFEARGTVRFIGATAGFKRCAVIRTQRRTVFIELFIAGGGGVARVHGDNSVCEAVFVQ